MLIAKQPVRVWIVQAGERNGRLCGKSEARADGLLRKTAQPFS